MIACSHYPLINTWLSMKLLVRNLARKTTENEIRELFAAHGTVNECNLVLDQKTNQSKGFAFVEMPDEAEAQAALTVLHESKVANSKIRVKVAQS